MGWRQVKKKKVQVYVAQKKREQDWKIMGIQKNLRSGRNKKRMDKKKHGFEREEKKERFEEWISRA